jgi:WD40 repeat protein
VLAVRKADRLCPQDEPKSTDLLHKSLGELGLADKTKSPMNPAEAEELLRQGSMKKAQGDLVGAQKCFDRARAGLEHASGNQARLQVEKGIWNVSAIAWSDDGTKLVVSSGQDIHVLCSDGKEPCLRMHTEDGPVSSLAISPDANLLASSTPNHDLTLWSLGSSDFGARKGTLEYKEGELQTLVFSPDGKTLAGRTWESAAPTLWDVESRQQLRTLNPIYRNRVIVGSRGGDHGGAWPKMLAFSPDGVSLLGAHDRTLAIWDLHSDTADIKRILPMTGPKLANEEFYSVAFHPKGRQFAVGTDAGKVILGTLAGDSPRAFQAHPSRPHIVFSQDGARLLSIAMDGSIRAFATKTLAPLGATQIPLPMLEAVAPHPDTHHAALAGQGKLFIADLASRKPLEVMRPPLALSAIAMNSNGSHMALGTPSGAIVLVSLRDGSFVWMHGHTARIESLAFSPNGRSLVSVSLDTTARIWDAHTQKNLYVLDHPKPLHGIAFHPDGRMFATSGDEGLVRVWDGLSGKTLASPTGTSCAVVSLAYSPNGSLLVANASDHSVLRWETATYTALPHAKSEHACVGGITVSSPTLGLSSDGTLVASAPGGNIIELWNTQTGQLQKTVPTTSLVRSLSVRTNDSVLAAAMGTTVRRWQLPNGTELPPLTIPDPSQEIDSLAFSADGQLVVGAGLRGTVSVWSMASGAFLLSLQWTNELSGIVTTPSGLAEWIGSRKPTVFCQLGARIYSADLCEDRAWTSGLVSKIFSGHPLITVVESIP